MKNYSQNNEQAAIFRLLGTSGHEKPGTFLDVGAHDGEMFSNTRALAMTGWGGVCVEPSPSVYPKLLELYRDRDDVYTVPWAIGTKSGKVKWFDSGGDGISTTEAAHTRVWSQVAYVETEVKSETWASLFDLYGYDFEVLSLDTEGTNTELSERLPLRELKRLAVAVVEKDHPSVVPESRARIIRAFASNGFLIADENAENLIFAR